MNYLNILPLTSSLFCVALVVFVFFRGRKQPAAMFFLAGMASLAIVEFCNFAALRASSEDSLLMWKGLSLVGEALFVNSWLLFSILFGKENTRKTLAKWKWILPPLYILTAILLIKVLANQTLLTGDSNIIQLGTMGKFFNLSLLIIVIITLMYLESTFRSSAGQERWRIKYILFGIGAIISLYVYIFSQRILYSTIDITNIYIMSSVILVSNILILYSIVKTNVISGETYISRRVIYTSISLIAIGLYSITVAIFVHIVRLFDISRNLKIDILLIFSAILILIIAFYNESFRRKTKLIINRHFRKSKYVYRDEWMVFSSELSKKINTHEVCEVFIKNLSERLFVKHLSIWLVEDDNRTLSIVSSQHIDEINIKIRLVDRIIQYIYYKNQPVNISAIKANKELLPLTREVSILLDKTKAQLIVPLLLGQRWVGLLTLGKIQTGERFDEIEDYNLLKSVSAHAASAINNAMLFERRMEAKELEAFSRLSSFMMHDLKNATSMLDMVAQNAKQHLCNPEFQKDAIETISGAVARMKKIIRAPVARMAGTGV